MAADGSGGAEARPSGRDAEAGPGAGVDEAPRDEAARGEPGRGVVRPSRLAAAGAPPPRRRGAASLRDMSFDESEARARRLVARVARRFHAAPVEVQERVGKVMALIDDLRIPHDRGLLLDQA